MITLEALQLVKTINFSKNIRSDKFKWTTKIDADRKTIPLVDFTRNMEKDTSIFFIIEEARETILDFLKGTAKVIWFHLVSIKHEHKTAQ